MLTSKITDTIEIPHEPGNTVTIRKLSHHQLMMSVDATVDDALGQMKKLGDVKLPEPDEETKRKRAEAVEDPRNKYHRHKILEYGITAWAGPNYEGDAVTQGTRDDLDETTALFLFDAIIAFSVRKPDDVKTFANGSEPRPVPVGLEN